MNKPANSGPYKFLDYFEDKDKDIRRFAGRELDIRAVVSRITQARVSVIYGRSGLGKTSLMNAGVFPVLRKRGYLPIYVRLRDQLQTDLENAVREKAEEAGVKGDLVQSLKTLGRSQIPVLVLDQFEEFFIRYRDQPEVRAQFIDFIGDLVDNRDLHFQLVFCLREDYVANLDDFRERIPDLFEVDYRLRPLDAFGSRKAAIQPLLDAGIDYEPRMIRRLVSMLEEVSYDPIFLQITCTQLHRNAHERAGDAPLHTIEMEDLKKIGSLDDVLEGYLAGCLRQFEGDPLVIRVILDDLITNEKTKKAVSEDHYYQTEFISQREELEQALSFLHDHRLIRKEQKDDKDWYELIHDRMVKPVLDWIEQDRDFFNYREARQQILNSTRSDEWRQRPELLLDKGKVEDVVGPFRKRLRLSLDQQELLLYSAIINQASIKHLLFWATTRGLKPTIDILLRLLKSKSETIREGALIAASHLPPDNYTHLANACMECALEDGNPALRRIAGAAYNRHIGDGANVQIKPLLKSKDKTKKTRAREIVADLSQANRKSFNFLEKWRAGREERRRILIKEESQDFFSAAGRSGALAGLLAAVLYLPFLTLTILFGGSWLQGDVIPDDYFLLVITGFFGFILGPLLGWRLGIGLGKHLLTQKRKRLFMAVFRCWSIDIVAFVFLFFLFYIMVADGESLTPFLIPLAWLLPVVAASYLGAAHNIKSRFLLYIWCCVCCLAWSPALSYIFHFLSILDPEDWEEFDFVLSGWIPFIFLLVQCVYGEVHLSNALEKRRVGRGVFVARVATGLAAVYSLVGFSWLWGFNSLPFLAEEVILPSPGESKVLHLNDHATYKADYYHFISNESEPVLLILPDKTEVVASSLRYYAGSDRTTLGLKTRFLPEISSEKPINLSVSDPTDSLFKTPLNPNGAIWQGEIQGNAKPDSFVATYILNKQPNYRQDFSQGSLQIEGMEQKLTFVSPNAALDSLIQYRGIRSQFSNKRVDLFNARNALSSNPANDQQIPKTWIISENMPMGADNCLLLPVNSDGEWRTSLIFEAESKTQTPFPLFLRAREVEKPRILSSEPNGKVPIPEGSSWLQWTVPENGRFQFLLNQPDKEKPKDDFSQVWEDGVLKFNRNNENGVVDNFQKGQTLHFNVVIGEEGAELSWVDLSDPKFSNPLSEEPPTNDAFDHAIVLTEPGSFSLDNNLATSEKLEPEGADMSQSVWWKWNSFDGGWLHLSVELPGGDYGLYAGETLSNLTLIKRGVLTRNESIFVDTDSSVYLRVGSKEGELVNTTGKWQFTPASPSTKQAIRGSNGVFEMAGEIPPNITVVAGMNIKTESQPGEPFHAGQPPKHSTWWKKTWDVVEGPVEVTVQSNAFQPVLAIYEGKSLQELTLTASNGGIQKDAARVYFKPVPQKTYYIAVDSKDNRIGSYRLLFLK